MKYQIVVKRPQQFGHPGAWYERPYPPVSDIATARIQWEEQKRVKLDAVEIVVLFADDDAPEALTDEYNRYMAGRPYASIEMSENGIREHIEFAPLREFDAYTTYTPPKALWRWFLHKDELRPLIQLMGRVWAGELGGKDDGLKEYGPEGKGA